MRRCLASLVALGALVGCSGGGGGNPDGGDGGGSNGDGGVGGTCNATAMPNTIDPMFTGYSLSVVGQDAYYVDPAPNGGRGAVHHVKLDGSGSSTVFEAPMGSVMNGVTAIGSDIYYFQEDDPQGSALHMYKTSPAGGAGTQVGTGTFPGFGVNIIGGGYAGIMAGQTFGIFAQRGTDLFVSDGTDISRVSSAGVKTVIATAVGGTGGIFWPTLVGSTVFYKDGNGAIYSVSADATSAGGARVGTATCGTGRLMYMASYTGGFLCGELFGLDKIDAMGVTKTHIIYTLMDKNVLQFNPTNVDGTTYYALPKDSAKDGAIYKFDVASNTPTAVTCAARAVIDYELTPTDLVYVELRGDGGNVALSLKRLVR